MCVFARVCEDFAGPLRDLINILRGVLARVELINIPYYILPMHPSGCRCRRGGAEESGVCIPLDADGVEFFGCRRGGAEESGIYCY